MGKRLTFEEACEVADRKQELFEKHFKNAMAAWNAWAGTMLMDKINGKGALS